MFWLIDSKWVLTPCIRASCSPGLLNIPDVLTDRLQWVLTPLHLEFYPCILLPCTTKHPLCFSWGFSFNAGLVRVTHVDISLLAPASLVDRLFITFFPLVYFNKFYETLPFLSRWCFSSVVLTRCLPLLAFSWYELLPDSLIQTTNVIPKLNLFNRLLIYTLFMSIKIEIRGPSPRCIFPRKEPFVYFSESHRDPTIALRVEIYSLSLSLALSFSSSLTLTLLPSLSCLLSLTHTNTHTVSLSFFPALALSLYLSLSLSFFLSLSFCLSFAFSLSISDGRDPALSRHTFAAWASANELLLLSLSRSISCFVSFDLPLAFSLSFLNMCSFFLSCWAVKSCLITGLRVVSTQLITQDPEQ